MAANIKSTQAQPTQTESTQQESAQVDAAHGDGNIASNSTQPPSEETAESKEEKERRKKERKERKEKRRREKEDRERRRAEEEGEQDPKYQDGTAKRTKLTTEDPNNPASARSAAAQTGRATCQQHTSTQSQTQSYLPTAAGGVDQSNVRSTTAGLLQNNGSQFGGSIDQPSFFGQGQGHHDPQSVGYPSGQTPPIRQGTGQRPGPELFHAPSQAPLAGYGVDQGNAYSNIPCTPFNDGTQANQASRQDRPPGQSGQVNLQSSSSTGDPQYLSPYPQQHSDPFRQQGPMAEQRMAQAPSLGTPQVPQCSSASIQAPYPATGFPVNAGVFSSTTPPASRQQRNQSIPSMQSVRRSPSSKNSGDNTHNSQSKKRRRGEQSHHHEARLEQNEPQRYELGMMQEDTSSAFASNVPYLDNNQHDFGTYGGYGPEFEQQLYENPIEDESFWELERSQFMPPNVQRSENGKRQRLTTPLGQASTHRQHSRPPPPSQRSHGPFRPFTPAENIYVPNQYGQNIGTQGGTPHPARSLNQTPIPGSNMQGFLSRVTAATDTQLSGHIYHRSATPIQRDVHGQQRQHTQTPNRRNNSQVPPYLQSQMDNPQQSGYFSGSVDSGQSFVQPTPHVNQNLPPQGRFNTVPQSAFREQRPYHANDPFSHHSYSSYAEALGYGQHGPRAPVSRTVQPLQPDPQPSTTYVSPYGPIQNADIVHGTSLFSGNPVDVASMEDWDFEAYQNLPDLAFDDIFNDQHVGDVGYDQHGNMQRPGYTSDPPTLQGSPHNDAYTSRANNINLNVAAPRTNIPQPEYGMAQPFTHGGSQAPPASSTGLMDPQYVPNSRSNQMQQQQARSIVPPQPNISQPGYNMNQPQAPQQPQGPRHSSKISADKRQEQKSQKNPVARNQNTSTTSRSQRNQAPTAPISAQPPHEELQYVNVQNPFGSNANVLGDWVLKDPHQRHREKTQDQQVGPIAPPRETIDLTRDVPDLNTLSRGAGVNEQQPIVIDDDEPDPNTDVPSSTSAFHTNTLPPSFHQPTDQPQQPTPAHLGPSQTNNRPTQPSHSNTRPANTATGSNQGTWSDGPQDKRRQKEPASTAGNKRKRNEDQVEANSISTSASTPAPVPSQTQTEDPATMARPSKRRATAQRTQDGGNSNNNLPQQSQNTQASGSSTSPSNPTTNCANPRGRKPNQPREKGDPLRHEIIAPGNRSSFQAMRAATRMFLSTGGFNTAATTSPLLNAAQIERAATQVRQQGGINANTMQWWNQIWGTNITRRDLEETVRRMGEVVALAAQSPPLPAPALETGGSAGDNENDDDEVVLVERTPLQRVASFRAAMPREALFRELWTEVVEDHGLGFTREVYGRMSERDRDDTLTLNAYQVLAGHGRLDERDQERLRVLSERWGRRVREPDWTGPRGEVEPEELARASPSVGLEAVVTASQSGGSGMPAGQTSVVPEPSTTAGDDTAGDTGRLLSGFARFTPAAKKRKQKDADKGGQSLLDESGSTAPKTSKDATPPTSVVSERPEAATTGEDSESDDGEWEDALNPPEPDPQCNSHQDSEKATSPSVANQPNDSPQGPKLAALQQHAPKAKNAAKETPFNPAKTDAVTTQPPPAATEAPATVTKVPSTAIPTPYIPSQGPSMPTPVPSTVTAATTPAAVASAQSPSPGIQTQPSRTIGLAPVTSQPPPVLSRSEPAPSTFLAPPAGPASARKRPSSSARTRPTKSARKAAKKEARARQQAALDATPVSFTTSLSQLATTQQTTSIQVTPSQQEAAPASTAVTAAPEQAPTQHEFATHQEVESLEMEVEAVPASTADVAVSEPESAPAVPILLDAFALNDEDQEFLDACEGSGDEQMPDRDAGVESNTDPAAMLKAFRENAEKQKDAATAGSIFERLKAQGKLADANTVLDSSSTSTSAPASRGGRGRLHSSGTASRGGRGGRKKNTREDVLGVQDGDQPPRVTKTRGKGTKRGRGGSNEGVQRKKRTTKKQKEEAAAEEAFMEAMLDESGSLEESRSPGLSSSPNPEGPNDTVENTSFFSAALEIPDTPITSTDTPNISILTYDTPDTTFTTVESPLVGREPSTEPTYFYHSSPESSEEE